VNKYDPVFKSIFEVYFSLPEALRAQFGQDEALLTEHVLTIDGLGALNRAPATGTQKFMGTDRSFINPKLDNTRAEISVKLSLNLRNETDNYIYKLFRAWAALGYNVNTGARHLKKDYCADFLKVSIANNFSSGVYRVSSSLPASFFNTYISIMLDFAISAIRSLTCCFV
jgi:hypothetical protein